MEKITMSEALRSLTVKVGMPEFYKARVKEDYDFDTKAKTKCRYCAIKEKEGNMSNDALILCFKSPAIDEKIPNLIVNDDTIRDLFITIMDSKKDNRIEIAEKVFGRFFSDLTVTAPEGCAFFKIAASNLEGKKGVYDAVKAGELMTHKDGSPVKAQTINYKMPIAGSKFRYNGEIELAGATYTDASTGKLRVDIEELNSFMLASFERELTKSNKTWELRYEDGTKIEND